MNATDKSGRLQNIPNCFLQIGSMNQGDARQNQNGNVIYFNNLPDLSDAKGANYESTPVIGRATPIPVYSNSEQRSISLSINFYVEDPTDPVKNLRVLALIKSAVYPGIGSGAPYTPPVICQLKVGNLLSTTVNNGAICCIMKDYNAKFPTDVPWDLATLCPYRLEVSMNFEQVFAGTNLPNSNMILMDHP